MKYNRLIIALFALVFISCQVETTVKNESIKEETIDSLSIETPLLDDINDILLIKGTDVLQTLDPVDINKLFYFAHPEKGILFSPYGFINSNTAKTLNQAELLALQQSNKKIIWGEFDGSGDLIELSFNDYFSRFVYDQNYRDASLFDVDNTLGKGNSINNIQDIFPNAHFIEFHFEGFDPNLQGMDWRSIRLVFDEIEGNLFLVAIIHDEWTI